MEAANKNAALQWLGKAKVALQEGKTEEAERLASKSLKLCPTEYTKEFLNKLQSSEGSTPSKPAPPSDSTPPPKEESSKPKEEEPKTSKESYTPEQAKAVKRVLVCHDYYEILEVPKTATEAEIKKQYKRLALQLHPDKNNAPKADDAFKAVSKAYAVLSDKDKRNDYDRFGEDGLRATNAYAEPDIDADQMFRMFFGDSFFGNGFGPSYSVHRDPFGRTVYRRRTGHSRYGHSHGSHSHSRQEPDSGLAMLCQLVPIVILLIVVLFGNVLTGFFPSASFSLYQSNSYPIKRYVKDFNIQYFVQKSFAREYVSNENLLASVEKEVINEYLWNLNHHCNSEKYSRRRRGKQEKPESCQKLEKLRKKLSKKIGK
ncbi:dnaJ homolog subfamily B member 14-like [Halichondria panicea]|uniref:dnaJ homolog subfamily B member 14-like n=1 Tax=Halichondria panicea TaxID=6063 RepID=UPI00312B4106